MDLNIIVAVCKNFGIGKDNAIPWLIHDDLRHFRELTQGNIIIMGRKTWESLPSRPLPNRLNIVVSSTPRFTDSYNPDDGNVIFTPIESLMQVLDTYWGKYSKAFVIGGAPLYEWAMSRANKIYMTSIEREYECDAFFPTTETHFLAYKLTDASPRHYCETEETYYRYLEFTNTLPISDYPSTDFQYLHEEYEYLRLIKDILQNGESRPDRTGVGTISTFAKQIRFDISDNIIPLITTKFVGWRGVLKELLWFLRGSTDSKELEAQGVNIWRDNSTREFLDSRGLSHYREGDIGPMYFYNIFNFGAPYTGCDHVKNESVPGGFDQMSHLITGLQTDPYSRRHLLTTYNPAVVDQSVLAPCHGIVIQFYVSGPTHDKQLSCHMYQRSMDTGLGACWNFASYAMLTHIIAAKVGMRAKELIISTGDTHIYSNHIEPLKDQLNRTPYPFPRFMFDTETIKNKDWKDLTPEDFDVAGYFSHPAIKLPMAV